MITKATADEGCTTYAQGGVCAVLDPLDSVDKHVQDTMVAGAHLNNPGYFSMTDFTCADSPFFQSKCTSYRLSSCNFVHDSKSGSPGHRRSIS